MGVSLLYVIGFRILTRSWNPTPPKDGSMPPDFLVFAVGAILIHVIALLRV